MSEEEVLLALETLAKALDIEVRYEKGDFLGGLCCVEGQNLIMVQKNEPPGRKIQTLARELGAFDLENVYVLPALRTLIETETAEGKRRTRSAAPPPAF